MLVREKIKKIVANACISAVESNKLEKADMPEIKIEYPKEERFGDYASSFATIPIKDLLSEIVKE